VIRSIVLALVLLVAAFASPGDAQIVCELCQEPHPGWEGFVVTSQESTADCRTAKGSAGVALPAAAAGPWQKDARRVAAIAFGRLPADRADDEKAGGILRQMTVVLQTDTDAIVLGRVGETERRVCLVRPSLDAPWVVVRLDVADLSRPGPAAGEPGKKP
jgi:hypothetical protein